MPSSPARPVQLRSWPIDQTLNGRQRAQARTGPSRYPLAFQQADKPFTDPSLTSGRTALDMVGTKRKDIRVVDRTTVREIGDRFEVEWRLSAEPELEWAEIFQLAEVPHRRGPSDWVEGAGPDVMGAVIRWFVPGEEIENAEAEVQSRVSVANQRLRRRPGEGATALPR